ncbi:MAG TPA: DUF456 family protein [Bacillota bacterium]|nr:DUF456 family protein [Bacillota bacterium]
MDILWWVLVILFFVGSFVGIVVPFIPDAILLWGGFLTYKFLLANQSLPLSFWWGMGALTILLLLADLLTNMLLVKKYGGSKWGMIASIVGIVIGPLILGPLGILFGPLLFVFLVEWALNKEVGLAAKVAFSQLGAFFGSAVVKFVLQLAMVIWFFVVV